MLDKNLNFCQTKSLKYCLQEIFIFSIHLDIEGSVTGLISSLVRYIRNDPIQNWFFENLKCTNSTASCLTFFTVHLKTGNKWDTKCLRPKSSHTVHSLHPRFSQCHHHCWMPGMFHLGKRQGLVPNPYDPGKYAVVSLSLDSTSVLSCPMIQKPRDFI